jgi:hypothetical protein
MIWAGIRFYMTKEGGYSDRCIGFCTDQFVKGAMMAETLCSGYTLACGHRAIIHDVRTIKGDHREYYVLPDDVVKLRDSLKDGIVI